MPGPVGAFRQTVASARERLRSRPRRYLEAGRLGRIEYAEDGDGPAVLVSHPLVGGFDVGLGTGRRYLGDGFRLVAPSRFGYLGSSLPPGATPSEQADAFASVPDAVGAHRVAVFGYSAGGPPAIQFALRHPARTSSLILLASAFPGPVSQPPRIVAELLMGSDVFFWALEQALPSAFARMLGMPKGFRPSGSEQQALEAIAASLFPVGPRKRGVIHDTYVSTPAVQTMPIQDLDVPTLVLHATDDGLSSFGNARAAAGRIPGATWVGFDAGGHLLLGVEAAVREHTSRFVAAHAVA